MLAVNQILQGRYRIIRLLGHGGMGAVYEAIDERFGEPIALKEIINDSARDKQKDLVSKAFEREAKSLAKAKHEVVPYVRDYFFEIGSQFLVMELVEGEDLGAMLEKRQSPFLLNEILNWMNQLLDALDYLHNLKPPIIHRDIKPQNLKLNSRKRIKLLDFGIARSSDSNSSTLTKQTFVGATLNYSPIEQILRVIDQTFREFILLKHKEKAEAVLRQDTDARCDIYSLGGTFYHLLTNQTPIDATKRTLDIWEGKGDPLPPPSVLNPQIPVSISNILMKAMAIERDQRYPSALEMQLVLKYASNELRKENSVIKTQAETLPLISQDDLKTGIAPIITNQKSDANHHTETQPLFENPSITDSSFSKSVETRPSGQFSNPDFIAPSYISSELTNLNKPEESKIIPLVEKVNNDKQLSRFKLFWLIPIGALVILTVSGIAAFFWLNQVYSTPSSANKSVNNQPLISASVTPTPVNTATPTLVTGASPTVSPTENPKLKPTLNPVQTQKTPESTKSVAVATPKKTPVSSAPVKTPLVRKTQKPAQDPNCIFTNSCQ